MTFRTCVSAIGCAAFLLGCPSKDPQSTGVAAPSSAGGGAAPTGPLAALETASFANETWTSQDGKAMPFINFAQQNVRVSADCRQPTGQLSCDAVRQLRSGPPVEVSNRQLTGGISAGTRACMVLKHQLVQGHNATGTEDSFCRYPDGSMVSTGALEQYGMRITP